MDYTMIPVQPEQRPPVSGEVIYAGFWRRVVAVIIDSLISQAASSLLAIVILLAASLGNHMGLAAIIFLVTANIVGDWLYQTLMESSKHQATLGKMAINIRVTDLDGNRLSWGRANARYFGAFLSGLTLGIGFIMAAFTQKKQALHDMIAGTLVLGQQQTVPASVAQNAFQS